MHLSEPHSTQKRSAAEVADDPTPAVAQPQQEGAAGVVPVAGLALRRESETSDDELGDTPVSDDVAATLTRRRSGGRPLTPRVAERMGRAMDADFSRVRIHDDHEADNVARSVEAKAFSVGTNLYFTRGSFRPGTSSGDHLLAHELAHTLEIGPRSRSGVTIGRADDPAEAAADRRAGEAVGRLRRMRADQDGNRPPATLATGSSDLRRLRWPFGKKKTKETEKPAAEPAKKADAKKDARKKVRKDARKDAAPEARKRATKRATKKVVASPAGPAVSDPTPAPAPAPASPLAPDPWDAAPLAANPKIHQNYLIPAGRDFWQFDGTSWVHEGPLGDDVTCDAEPSSSAGFIHARLGGALYAFNLADAVLPEHVVESDPVFPVDAHGNVIKPKPADVIQGSVGDCYLEAALAALAKTDPDAIIGMVRDQGTSVTVRLHDVDRSDPSAPAFTPVYVKVEKSRARHGGGLMYDAGALWVGMIEKAYTAGRFGGGEDETNAARLNPDPAYKSIADGYSFYAFEVVAGKAAARHAIDQGSSRSDAAESVDLPWNTHEYNGYQTLKAAGGDYRTLAAYAALGDAAKVDGWFAWLDGGGWGAIKDMYADVDADPSGYAHGAIRLGTIEDLFTAQGLSADIAAPMLTHLGRHFPGKRGSGKYSWDNLQVFADIKAALDAGKAVALSSHKAVGRASSGTGHSGGESKTKGLVGSHAFTALDAKTDDAGRKFVLIRNPWGKYGRSYDAANKPVEVADGDGTSWIELADVVKRFHSFDVL